MARKSSFLSFFIITPQPQKRLTRAIGLFVHYIHAKNKYDRFAHFGVIRKLSNFPSSKNKKKLPDLTHVCGYCSSPNPNFQKRPPSRHSSWIWLPTCKKISFGRSVVGSELCVHTYRHTDIQTDRQTDFEIYIYV